MTFLLRMTGVFLLLLAGYGAGYGVMLRHRARWRQLHTFAELLTYLQGVLCYQALTGTELLRRAQTYRLFDSLGLENCAGLSDLPLPAALALPQQEEFRDGLYQMEMQPREKACATLERLASLCEEAAENERRNTDAARVLWPRLGLCAGVLLVILLW